MKTKETRRERSDFSRIRNAEREYAQRMRAIARNVQSLIRAFVHPEDEEIEPTVLNRITRELNKYAETIQPYAESVARRMLSDVQRRDETAWRRLSKQVGRQLFKEINHAPTGQVVREALERQVHYITSLPREAASRVQALALTGTATGRRAGEIRYPARPPGGLAKDILDTGHVTVSRANLIARTETTRAATELTKARADFVGSTHFIWRTARDADVRPTHKKLEGTVHRWDDPPIAEVNGERHLPGAFPNCRCFAEPILPAEIV